ncbi:ferredoxin, 2fe-2s-like protein [Leishmania braziliensis MHOM/BR/75/M2904]|uniref:Ferredoxin, 2fe-2s-like protein n=2 Tax=Leishmania braziliensis TaxID=5660 RepID=A4HJN3_LEIBR|nr:ferredoxin, 2fe-2s-like protein [Leishmania braziliensis MHOM/BR/75/M2904]XP_001567274.1 ferredoxin, 2fe-2s-like protein [Leishmania braziliensis MHOM/BR/75/M2904]KAI5687992.1 2Fe2S ironsulfur cluster binding domain containing protein [Leishmania braziliensis]KAI5689948.1 2Fe2S ironsulfur cluster binding domain containing protein [Leishmania braziliensis]CAJ2465447.1 unnamed protein product [Leishmania braziliensis]CAJ2478071.1 unnamed protein product [Leishmania braziliensis]CAJ2478508.1 
MRRYSSLRPTGVLLRPPLIPVGTLCTPRTSYSTPGKVKVCVKTQDGTLCDFEAPAGMSLMHAIRDVAKLEMDGACDGCAQCSTCHVYLSKSCFKKLGKLSEQEQDILDKALDLKDTSRLACQIILTPDMSGLEVALPRSVTNLLL